jgi:hypothetical protein
MANEKRKTPEPVAEATVRIVRHPDDALMGLHREIGTGDFGFGKVRFCQSVALETFWLTIDKPGGGWATYSLSTEELMNAVLNAVAPTHARPEA